ncbi:MAG TPA: thioredoxin family protein [Bacillota bacterium]|jgi:thiol-disulfide isomerase/thioredoxin
MRVMDEARFGAGRTFAAYAADSVVAGPALQTNYQETAVPAETVAAVGDLVRRAGGRINVVVVSEEWCPDCQDNLPVLAKLADTVPGMSLRVFGRDASPDLVREYSVEGKMRIPTAVFYDPAWREIARWIERPAKAAGLMEKAGGEVRRAVREQYKYGLREETMREVTEAVGLKL